MPCSYRVWQVSDADKAERAERAASMMVLGFFSYRVSCYLFPVRKMQAMRSSPNA